MIEFCDLTLDSDEKILKLVADRQQRTIKTATKAATSTVPLAATALYLTEVGALTRLQININI